MRLIDDGVGYFLRFLFLANSEREEKKRIECVTTVCAGVRERERAREQDSKRAREQNAEFNVTEILTRQRNTQLPITPAAA